MSRRQKFVRRRIGSEVKSQCSHIIKSLSCCRVIVNMAAERHCPMRYAVKGIARARWWATETCTLVGEEVESEGAVQHCIKKALATGHANLLNHWWQSCWYGCTHGEFGEGWLGKEIFPLKQHVCCTPEIGYIILIKSTMQRSDPGQNLPSARKQPHATDYSQQCNLGIIRRSLTLFQLRTWKYWCFCIKKQKSPLNHANESHKFQQNGAF